MNSLKEKDIEQKLWPVAHFFIIIKIFGLWRIFSLKIFFLIIL